MKTPIAVLLWTLAANAFATGGAMNSLSQADASSGRGSSAEAVASNSGAPFSGGRVDSSVNTSASSGSGRRVTLLALGRGGNSSSETKSSDKGTCPAPVMTPAERKGWKFAVNVGYTLAVLGVCLIGITLPTPPVSIVVAAAALIFFGGMTAYLGERRLKGKEDFKSCP